MSLENIMRGEINQSQKMLSTVYGSTYIRYLKVVKLLGKEVEWGLPRVREVGERKGELFNGCEVSGRW
jgi:hypothetical protein